MPNSLDLEFGPSCRRLSKRRDSFSQTGDGLSEFRFWDWNRIENFWRLLSEDESCTWLGGAWGPADVIEILLWADSTISIVHRYWRDKGKRVRRVLSNPMLLLASAVAINICDKQTWTFRCGTSEFSEKFSLHVFAWSLSGLSMWHYTLHNKINYHLLLMLFIKLSVADVDTKTEELLSWNYWDLKTYFLCK